MAERPPRRVLITGAATGAGLALARALSVRGDTVLMVGRQAERLRAAADELGARAVPWNITRDPETLLAITAPLDHLIHAASRQAPAVDWAQADAEAVFAVGAIAPARLARAFATQADPAVGPGVLFVVSPLARQAAPDQALAAAAQAALLSLAGSLAGALAPVRVNALIAVEGAAVATLGLRALDDTTLTGKVLSPKP
ncbi:MAG: SDR family NAD(P)-dependent oxidoreductase [Alphaproteobacteria bacterium]|nr:SDR family NAD(P)-dependent oxidoreductase [Alphaproteobacteria bacterium]